jgi:hypothetical protein
MNTNQNREPSLAETIGMGIASLLSEDGTPQGEPSVVKTLLGTGLAIFGIAKGMDKNPIATTAAIAGGIYCLSKALDNGFVNNKGNRKVREAIKGFIEK